MQKICKKCGARKKFLKHPPFEQDRRTHVEYWVGKQDWDGRVSSETRCSEPDCELNEVKPNSSHD